jgi:hypothetical protein
LLFLKEGRIGPLLDPEFVVEAEFLTLIVTTSGIDRTE